jgi:hypothetical protein
MLGKVRGLQVIARFRHEVGAVDSPTEWSVDEALARRIVPELPSIERLRGAMACMYFVKTRWDLYPASDPLLETVLDVLREALGPRELERFSVRTAPDRIRQLDRPLPPLGGKVKATFWAELLGKEDLGLAIANHFSGWHVAELAPRSVAHLVSELLTGPDAVERKSTCLGLHIGFQGRWPKEPGPKAWTTIIQGAAYRCLWWDNTGQLGEGWGRDRPR